MGATEIESSVEGVCEFLTQALPLDLQSLTDLQKWFEDLANEQVSPLAIDVRNVAAATARFLDKIAWRVFCGDFYRAATGPEAVSLPIRNNIAGAPGKDFIKQGILLEMGEILRPPNSSIPNAGSDITDNSFIWRVISPANEFVYC
jgi:hypothetical protein